MSTHDLTAFREVFHPEAVNREAAEEPEDCRRVGPEAFRATARWLTTAFSDLKWDAHEVVAEGDLVVVHATMSGRQTGPFVAYGADARVEMVFPPRGRSFAVTQTHWFRVLDGLVIEHWANRDDSGMGQQLGWTPPSPVYLARMALATRAARKAAARSNA
jgi:predicted ester cyclase